ncbi:MAG: MFS transporter [Polyangiaceae bacterium]|jgi:MFS family permease|nr:MFS transporter [Polyangiaceae bacterium]
MSVGPRKSASSVLRRPSVRRWVLARLLSGIAMTSLRATVLWQVYDLTRSLALLGLVGLLSFLPAPIAALTGGVVADAYDRKRVVLIAQGVELVCALGLTALSSTPGAPLAALFGVFVVNFTALSFEAPARQSMLPRLVPREELPRAVTVMSAGQALAFVTGPTLAGFLLGWFGATVAFGVSVALIAVSIALVLAVHETVEAPARRPVVGLAALREGLKYVVGNKIVLGALSIDLFAVIFGGATAMLPVYARDVLQIGAKGYGLLAACLDVGALATSLVMIFMPPIQRIGRAILISVVVYGAATIAFGLSRSIPLSVATYFLVGVADQVSVVSRSTLVQLSTPDELRGRVSSVNMVFIIASNQLSVAESGFVAALTSPTFAVVSGGVMVFLVAVVVALLVPELWRAKTPTGA